MKAKALCLHPLRLAVPNDVDPWAAQRHTCNTDGEQGLLLCDITSEVQVK